MLQCGGNNNISAALLKEFFMHERKNDEHFRKICKSPRTSPRGNQTGILPCITQHTDIASLRRSPRARRVETAPHDDRMSPGSGLSATLSSTERQPQPGGSPSPMSDRRPPRFLSSSRQQQRLMPFELPNKGIGVGAQPTAAPPAREGAGSSGTFSDTQASRPPRHGRQPPYNRKHTTLEFWDAIRANGVACLCPQATII